MKSRVFAAIIGILLLGGAAVYIAVNMFGRTDLLTSMLRGWWTVFLIVPGIMGLFSRASRVSSVGLLLLGIGLLCREQDWFGLISPANDISWWQMALAIVLVLAAFHLFRFAFGRKKRFSGITADGSTIRIETGKAGCGSDKCDASRGCGTHTTRNGIDEHSGIFGDCNTSYCNREFSGADVNGIFGRTEIDLRGAIINSDCTLTANAVFGSVIILAGENANFEVTKTSLAGNIASDGLPAYVEGLPTVRVDANAVFGSVEFK